MDAQYLPAFLGLALVKLQHEQDFKTSNLRIMCLNVVGWRMSHVDSLVKHVIQVIAAVFYNPALFFATLEQEVYGLRPDMATVSFAHVSQAPSLGRVDSCPFGLPTWAQSRGLPLEGQ